MGHTQVVQPWVKKKQDKCGDQPTPASVLGRGGNWGRRTTSYPKREECSTFAQKGRHLNVMLNHTVFKSQ